MNIDATEQLKYDNLQERLSHSVKFFIGNTTDLFLLLSGFFFRMSCAKNLQDEKMDFAERYTAQSVRLTTSAKLLVEALIEGQATESDLIAAQKMLEKGDLSADREILSRLTRKGMDIAGEPPLFPDIDGLYNALDALNTQEDAP
jgi:hypothetical protein